MKSVIQSAKHLLHSLREGVMTLLEDIGHGFFLISHNGFALVGVSVVLLCALLILRPELRSSSEALLMS